MGRMIWGYWDCKTCGATGIKGELTSCPNCGTPVTSDTEFYMREGVVEYVAPDKENREANWICPYCGRSNNYANTSCEGCGASRGESEERHGEKRNGKQETEHTEVLPTDYDALLNEEQEYEEHPVFTSEYSTPKHKKEMRSRGTFMASALTFLRRNQMPVFITVAVLICIAICCWLFIPIWRPVTVNGLSWERVINIEELRTFNESDWELPANARLKYTNWEYKTSVPVHDRYEQRSRDVSHVEVVGTEIYYVYENKENGQFEEVQKSRNVTDVVHETEYYTTEITKMSEVYDTKYYYEIDRWVHSREVKTGGIDKNVYWGNVILQEKERRGSSEETYEILVMLNDKAQYLELGYSDWEVMEIGVTMKVKTFRFGKKILDYEYMLEDAA